MNDERVILVLLARVARRLWLNRSLQELGFAASLLFLALLTYRLAQPALNALPFSRAPAVVGAAVILVCMLYVLVRALRRSTLAQAAGEVDARARLKDELKTAYWLSTQHDRSPIVQLQISRAVHTCQRIDPANLVPARFPRSAWSVLLLGAMTILASVWAPPSAHSWQAGRYGPPTAPSSEDIGAPLLDVQPDDATRKLQRALAMLQRGDASPEEVQQALAQAREAQDEINLRAAAAREALASLAAGMASRDDSLKNIGQALEQGRTAEALETLKRLASETGSTEQQGDPGSAQRSEDASRLDTDALDDESRGPDPKINEEALEQVLKDIEDAQNALNTQSRVAQVRRRMEDFLVAATQRRSLTAARFGNQASTPSSTPAPETGNASMQGGTMFRQGAVAQGKDPQDAQGGSEIGAAAGSAEALPVEGARTERLDAKLKRESVSAASESREKALEQGWTYKPTQGGTAQTRFAEVRSRSHFAAADAPQREEIPVRQRSMVRDYFVNLHQSEQ
jgi:hypothetical protein